MNAANYVPKRLSALDLMTSRSGIDTLLISLSFDDKRYRCSGSGFWVRGEDMCGEKVTAITQAHD